MWLFKPATQISISVLLWTFHTGLPQIREEPSRKGHGLVGFLAEEHSAHRPRAGGQTDKTQSYGSSLFLHKIKKMQSRLNHILGVHRLYLVGT